MPAAPSTLQTHRLAYVVLAALFIVAIAAADAFAAGAPQHDDMTTIVVRAL